MHIPDLAQHLQQPASAHVIQFFKSQHLEVEPGHLL